jgi:hypothetical protein
MSKVQEDSNKTERTSQDNLNRQLTFVYSVIVNRVVSLLAAEFHQNYKLTPLMNKFNHALKPLGIHYNTKQRFYQLIKKGKEVRNNE